MGHAAVLRTILLPFVQPPFCGRQAGQLQVVKASWWVQGGRAEVCYSIDVGALELWCQTLNACSLLSVHILKCTLPACAVASLAALAERNRVREVVAGVGTLQMDGRD